MNVEVVPLDASQRRSVLVLFEPVLVAAARNARRIRRRSGLARRSSGPPDLEVETQHPDARQRLLSVVEEHQISEEESQNTTEEALSANEELQSLNEELETAKEELQSTNEELITVNDELQAKNAALAQARDFAMSIVETVRQPLLVLDTDLRSGWRIEPFNGRFWCRLRKRKGSFLYALLRGSWDVPALRDVLDGLVHGGVAG